MSTQLEIRVTEGPLKGRRFSVPDDGLRLGRSSSCEISIPDPALSRNHCLFETRDGGLWITDLASANGTIVNEVQLGPDSQCLQLGDVVFVGDSALQVVAAGEKVPAPASAPAGESALPVIDLGLGAASGSAEKGDAAPSPSGGKPSARQRAMLANVLWIVAALMVAAAIAVVLCMPRESEKPVAPVVEEKPEQKLISLRYEKIEADASRVFSYRMDVDESGVLHVAFDDVPGENRHVDKRTKLSEKARKRILEVLEKPDFAALDDEYVGSSVEDDNALRRFRIRVVRWNSVKDILVENTQEPDAFREVRESLEAFSRNELGIWAIQYSKEKLIELSEESAKIGDAKWDDRDVEYGNLSASVKAYRDALFYLDTVNPKPASYAVVKERMSRSEAELKQRYEDQRFLADKAINLGDWEQAQTELKILCELVPERDDPRHAEANARLVDVENRMKKARGGK